MPGQNLRSSTAAPAAAPLNGYYPKLLRGASGSVWLVTAPKTGVIVHLSGTPQKGKHKIGYYTTRLVEAKMSVHNNAVTISAS